MNRTPHKSTTHDERFFHFREAPGAPFRGGTVFARKEADGWYASVSACAWEDAFCRAVGRQTARRRYFHGYLRRKMGQDQVTYEQARALYGMTAFGLMLKRAVRA